jgi:catechol 2,3-dioxygenase-like lactoylglutathione lyase family enzyme
MEPQMKPRVSLVTLGVADLARSRRFYVDGLGLPVRDIGSEAVVFLQMGATVLALWGRQDLAEDAGVSPEGSGFRSFSLAHNVTSKAEVDALLRQAVEAGGTLIKPATDAVWGGYTGYFADPDGFLWEVAWNPDMPDLAE